MRSILLASLVACVGVSGLARADSPAILDAYAPLRAVGILLDTEQVLFFDEAVHEYRICKVGDSLEGWRVVAIDVDAHKVIVVQDAVRDELVLAKVPHKLMLAADMAVVSAPVAQVAAPAAPVVPAGPMATPVAVVTPTPAVVAAVPAVATQPAPAVVTPAPAPAVVVTPTPAPALVPPPTPAPAVVVTPTPAPAVVAPPMRPSAGTDVRVEPTVPRVVEENHILSRTELSHELSNFDQLMTGVQITGARGGGFMLLKLDARSWIASTGLRSGDIVRSIAGERISSIEDAARVYARLQTLNAFVVEVDRSGQRVVLHFDIK